MAQRLRARQEALRAETAAEEDVVGARLRAGRSLRVLFIGGNETQAQYEAALRAALERRDETTGARVQIEFRTPGYNSNWDKTLEAVRGYRGRVDAIVLMPYVRTQLGRALRRLASEWGVPWVSCTGKGYDSLERALRAALVLAARQ
jgi:phosphoglycolate phosphatase-like HAD superfamily hydrolase